VAVKKSHADLSCLRLHGTLDRQVEDGRLSAVPNYSLPSRILGQEDLTPVLIHLIRESAKPLAHAEAGGTIAIDSSGFTMSVFGAYYPETHDAARRHEFVKAHIAVGVRTQIVTDVVVTDQHGGDSPQFKGLLQATIDSGFSPATVVADKAYLSRENYRFAEELGVQAYIPFRSNVGPQPKGIRVWRDMWHMFQIHREAFDDQYHRRVQVESTFSSVKRTLGEALFSRRPVARRNELLCKILSHNLQVLIAEMVKRGVDPGTLFERKNPPAQGPDSASSDPSALACERIHAPVNKSALTSR